MAKYPLIQLVLPYCAGILLANHLISPINWWFYVAQIVVLISILFYHLKNRRQQFSVLLYLLFLSIGYQGSMVKSGTLNQNHFSNYINDNIKSQVEGTLVDWPIETRKYFKAEVEVDKLYTIDRPMTGKLQVFFSKNNASSNLIKGDRISFIDNIIKDDKGRYIVFLDEDWGRILNHKLKYKLSGFNAKLLSQFKGLEIEERTLVSSLLFGRREFMTWDMKGVYQKSGMMHLLAISGMHVGIIYLLLSSVLSFLNRGLKKRRVKSVIIICCLVFYAAFTGFSPSVSRAVLMFSLFAFGDLIGKPVNRFQVLLSAAFILLLINPLVLLNVGAQLSFTAVFFIIWLFPKYKNHFDFKFSILNKLWQLVLISLIAQIATAPILAYYFGAISLVSTFSSVIGVPLVTVIICTGAVLLLLTPLKGVFDLFVEGYSYLLKLMNTVSTWFSELPFSQIEVSISGVQLILIYLVLLIILSKSLRSKLSFLTNVQFYRRE